MSGAIGLLSSSLPSPASAVSIIVGGQQISGWTRVLIRCGIEVMPASFDLGLTELDPSEPLDLTITAGSPCQVLIGDQVVITGYVDRVLRSVSVDEHEVRVIGRSMSEDLVDCSAIFATYQVQGTSVLALAQKLCTPFGIKVVTPTSIPTVTLPAFDVVLTETPYEILERVCRYACLLMYDDTTGNVILTQVGSTEAASGFVMPGNVERADSALSMDERFSEIQAVALTTDSLQQMPGPDGTLTSQLQSLTVAYGTDPGVPRFRPLLIPLEQGDLTVTTSSGAGQAYPVTHQRVLWELARRWGRSQAVQLTCDSWTDTSGVLWGPNTLAPVSLPAIKIQPSNPWLISEIAFRLDDDGTHADITLMPMEAFLPQPIVLNPASGAITQATTNNAFE